jgi:hypothetical protein
MHVIRLVALSESATTVCVCDSVVIVLVVAVFVWRWHKRYQSEVCKRFVDSKTSKALGQVKFSHCKSPLGCEGVLRLLPGAVATAVQCEVLGCNFRYCSLCDFPPHHPATCEMMSAWEAKGGFTILDDKVCASVCTCSVLPGLLACASTSFYLPPPSQGRRSARHDSEDNNAVSEVRCADREEPRLSSHDLPSCNWWLWVSEVD